MSTPSRGQGLLRRGKEEATQDGIVSLARFVVELLLRETAARAPRTMA
jgi:hypothetical protein